MTELTPVTRAALLAAYSTPSHSLRRTRGGFAAAPAHVRTSGAVTVQAFTRRAINWLEADGLVEFDDPMFPTTVKLTNAGVVTAGQIIQAERAKAGAA